MFIENAARLQGYPENQAFINVGSIKEMTPYDRGVYEATVVDGKKFYLESSAADYVKALYGINPKIKKFVNPQIMYMQNGENGWTAATYSNKKEPISKKEVKKIINICA